MYELACRGSYFPVVYGQALGVGPFGRVCESEVVVMDVELAPPECGNGMDLSESDGTARDAPGEMDEGFIVLSAWGGIMFMANVERR